ncbi:hypothetical protein LINPERHAP2_LOCUS11149 [Linum perenne]
MEVMLMRQIVDHSPMKNTTRMPHHLKNLELAKINKL